MADRLYSIAVNYATLYGCHELLGSAAVGRTDAAVISAALEILIDRLQQSGRLQRIKEQDAIYMHDKDKWTAPISTSIDVNRVAEEIEAANTADDERLANAIVVNSLERVSADVKIVSNSSTPPWMRSKLYPEDEYLLSDLTYINAPNDMFKLAVRAVYAYLERNQWSTETSTKLIMQTYEIFTAWV